MPTFFVRQAEIGCLQLPGKLAGKIESLWGLKVTQTLIVHTPFRVATIHDLYRMSVGSVFCRRVEVLHSDSLQDASRLQGFAHNVVAISDMI
jgi:hypothetical protein